VLQERALDVVGLASSKRFALGWIALQVVEFFVAT